MSDWVLGTDIDIVPPMDDSDQSIRIFYDQICEILNQSSNFVKDPPPSLPEDLPTIVFGLVASSGYGAIILNFSAPTYDGHNYTIFVRSEDSDINHAIGVGTTSSNRFVDTIADPQIGQVYTYWAKHVNLAGVSSSSYSSPASASVSPDVDYSIDLLLGKLGYDEFKTGSFPVRTEDSLPILPDAKYPVGSYVLLTTSSKTYENRNNVTWTMMLPGESITVSSDTLVAGKLAVGALVVDDAVMQNGYIKTALIGDAQITNAKIDTLQADKITTGIIDASIRMTAATIVGGVIETNPNPVANGGILMTGDTMTVYDASGNIRVKIGRL